MREEPKKVDRRNFLYVGLGAIALAAIGAAAYIAMNPPVVTQTTTVPTTSVITSTTTSVTTVPTTSVVTTTIREKLITMVSMRGSATEKEVYGKIFADFEKQYNAKVEIEYAPSAQLFTRISSLIAAGTPPTVIDWGEDFASLAPEGSLYPLTDVVKKLKVEDGFRIVWSGEDVFLPLCVKPANYWYREDVLKKSGIVSFPKTWSEFLDTAKTLRQTTQLFPTIVPSGANNLTSNFTMAQAYRNNVKYITKENGAWDVAFDKSPIRERMIETLSYLKELAEFSPNASGYDWGNAIEAFQAEKVTSIYYLSGRPLFGAYQSGLKIEDVMKVAPLPAGPSAGPTMVCPDGFFVLKDGPNPDLGVKLLDFIVSSDYYIKWLHSVPLHYLPPSRDVLLSASYLNNTFVQKHPEVVEFYAKLWQSEMIKMSREVEPVSPYTMAVYNASIPGEMVANVIHENKDPEKVIEEVAEKIRKQILKM